jgi:group I intron endonuclease
MWTNLTDFRTLPKSGGLYVIRHKESGLEYVGKTTNFYQRMCKHRHPEKRSSYISRAIVTDGAEMFEVMILVQSTDDAWLLQEEIRIIAERGTQYPGGYNLTAGGEGHLGFKPNAETRAKLAEATRRLHTGKKRSAETVANISASLKGRKAPVLSPEARERIVTATRGVPNPKKGTKGEQNHMFGVRGGAHPRAKTVLLWEPGSSVPKIFDSAATAAHEAGVTLGLVADWCRGRFKPKSGRVYAYE